MVQRIAVRDDETPDRARRRFDGKLGVRGWTAPGAGHKQAEPRDPKAPWWWEGAQEASQSFLTAMGVTLT